MVKYLINKYKFIISVSYWGKKILIFHMQETLVDMTKISSYIKQMIEKRTSTWPDKKEKAPEGMSGLAKGLAVIEAFNEKGKHMTIAEISRATNLSRATARRCLLTLTECGYLFFDGKYFQPAPRIMKLGASYRNVATLPQIAQPFSGNSPFNS